MSDYIQTIKNIAATKKISLKVLAKEIGMSETGLHGAIRNKTLRVEKLLDICHFLEINPSYLFQSHFEKIKNENPSFGMSEKDILIEVLKTVKGIENKLDTQK